MYYDLSSDSDSDSDHELRKILSRLSLRNETVNPKSYTYVSMKGIEENVRLTHSEYLHKYISKVYYSNSMKGGHSRIIVVVDGEKFCFSYGHLGMFKGHFSEEGKLDIQHYDKPLLDVPLAFKLHKHKFSYTNLTLEDAIGYAKKMFKDEYHNYNYWTKNCYHFTDELYQKLTNEYICELDWFKNEIKDGKSWVYPGKLGIYGVCPY
jgi:hypothetical protein